MLPALVFSDSAFRFIFLLNVNLSRMFAQSNQDVPNIDAAQNPTKSVRSCFIRLLRDKDLDEHIRKRSKKNDTEVNQHIVS